MALLSRGSSGSEVRELQNKLEKLGFLSSAPSSTFDAATESAVKTFQTQRPWLLIDGVVGYMTLDEINDSIQDIDGKTELDRIASGAISLSLNDLKQNRSLCVHIQKRLRALGLYPGGKLIDGDFGSLSQEALKHFCNEVEPSVSEIFPLDSRIAQKLRDMLQIPSVLAGSSKNQIKEKISKFQRLVDANSEKLGFLDMGSDQSPFKTNVYQYPQLFDKTRSAGLKTSKVPNLSYSPYPDKAKDNFPSIDTDKLSFLESNLIAEACVCLGHFEDGQLTTSWLGKNELALVECWSTSKIIPILNVLCQLGSRIPSNPNNIQLKSQGSTAKGFELPSAFIDICSYRSGVPHSNALSATLNSFEGSREAWIKKQTGNTNPIIFGGKYFEEPTIRFPELIDRLTEKSRENQLLSHKEKAVGGNSISVYDLTRFMSLVGWHSALSTSQQLPGMIQQGLNLAIIAMGTDTARYVDTAFSMLGIENVIDSPIVISKLGFGPSTARSSTDLVYTAFVQFVDKRDQDNSPKLRSLALTLRATTKGLDNEASIKVDSGMALAVTEIIRRIVTEDF
jgi:peptidoglycan hydrolase-like protein with peptidoglycan-binding domain